MLHSVAIHMPTGLYSRSAGHTLYIVTLLTILGCVGSVRPNCRYAAAA